MIFSQIVKTICALNLLNQIKVYFCCEEMDLPKKRKPIYIFTELLISLYTYLEFLIEINSVFVK